MNSILNLKFENVWGQSHEIENDIISFWKTNQVVLNDEQYRQRIKEVVFVIRGEDDSIAGVSTAAKTIYKPLDNYVYLYRCFIQEEYRAPALDTQLIIKTRDFLEAIYINENPSSVGLIVVAQNEFLKKYNKAVWPGSELMFIGNTATGDPVRIYYFKGAKI